MKEPPPRCVVDSNVILDLHHGAIVRVLFRLPYEMLSTPMLVQEIRTLDTARLFSWGLIQCELSPDDTTRMLSLKRRYNGLSVPDCSALILAQSQSGILLTGESLLRRMATEMGIEKHGTLWVLDEAIALHLLSPFAAGQALISMIRAGSRLPEQACKRRLKRWLPGHSWGDLFVDFDML